MQTDVEDPTDWPKEYPDLKVWVYCLSVFYFLRYKCVHEISFS